MCVIFSLIPEGDAIACRNSCVVILNIIVKRFPCNTEFLHKHCYTLHLACFLTKYNNCFLLCQPTTNTNHLPCVMDLLY